MTKLALLLLATLSLPALAHHNTALLSSDYLNYFGLFLIALSVLFSTLSVMIQTHFQADLAKITSKQNLNSDHI